MYVTSILLGLFLRQGFSYTFFPHSFFDLWLFSFVSSKQEGICASFRKMGETEKLCRVDDFSMVNQRVRKLWGGEGKNKRVNGWVNPQILQGNHP